MSAAAPPESPMSDLPATAPPPGAAPAPSKRAIGREIHRLRILDEAERIFAAKGYPGTTVAEIAAAAGLAVGTIYNFFPGKDALAEAVMVRIASDRAAGVEALAAAPEAGREETLRALVRLRVAQFFAHGAFLRMGIEYRRSLGRFDPPEGIRALFARHVAATERVFARGLALGHVRPLPAADLAHVFEGVCREWFFQWGRKPEAERESADALQARLFDVLSVLLFP